MLFQRDKKTVNHFSSAAQLNSGNKRDEERGLSGGPQARGPDKPTYKLPFVDAYDVRAQGLLRGVPELAGGQRLHGVPEERKPEREQARGTQETGARGQGPALEAPCAGKVGCPACPELGEARLGLALRWSSHPRGQETHCCLLLSGRRERCRRHSPGASGSRDRWRRMLTVSPERPRVKRSRGPTAGP